MRAEAHAPLFLTAWRCPPPHLAQVQSNALAALEAMDKQVAERIMAEGCITGDRINGLCDGVTGDWCALLPQRARGAERRRTPLPPLHHRAMPPSLARRYIKFDTFHPAVDKGLPVTRVISRVTLQARTHLSRCAPGCPPSPCSTSATSQAGARLNMEPTTCTPALAGDPGRPLPRAGGAGRD